MSEINSIGYAQADTLRAATLADLAEVLKSQRARALDVVAPANTLRVADGQLVVAGVEPVLTDEGVDSADGTFRLTQTAESGIATRLDVPVGYLRRMRAQGRFDLYDGNVNGWLHGNGAEHAADSRSFLVRMLRSDANGSNYVRAFLSDRYRTIDSLDVLLATLKGIGEAGVDVQIRQADLTESRMYVRVYSPDVVAMAPDLLRDYDSPFNRGALRVEGSGWSLEQARAAAKREGLGFTPGEEPIVFGGFIIRNSETGEGRFEIAPQLIVNICGNGLTLTMDAISKTHLGAKLDAGRIEWSADTERANVDLITKQTRDAVRSFLTVESVERAVATLTEQAAVPVADAPEVVKVVAKKLKFTDVESASILEHFLIAGQRTAGGVMQAVSSVAQTVTDADRADALENAAIPALALAASAS